MWTRLLTVPPRLTAVLLMACAAHGAAVADEADPPGRVARLSDAEGSVSLQPAGVQDWAAASVNRPLTTGDKLWTDENSRAELDIGAAVIRLGPTTGFSFLNLDDGTAQMQVTAGTLIIRVRDVQPGQIDEIDTPNIALSLQQPGEYRVEVNEAGDVTVVKVSEGVAQASGGGQTVAVSTQQAVSFSGTETLAYESGTLGAPDDLDNWSAARERQVEDSPSREYVADDVAGTQDLDGAGRWASTPEYGNVWTPTAIAVGWAPYRFGHWVWIAPWGWTWVDDAPWGYAPFHYGRWVVWNDSWCWVPGPRHVRPVYAPALVAWVGGPALGVSVAFGRNVGWFPLGPREVYVPAYPVSSTYVRNVNVTNTTIINNTYITNVYERNVTPRYVNNTASAVTAVPQDVFVSGQRVGGRALRVPSATLASATVAPAAPAITPIRQSVLGPTMGRGAARPPAALLNRAVMARTPPPRAPAPFERQSAAIAANGGRPLTRADLAQLQPAAPAVPVHVARAGTVPVPAAALARGAAAGRSQPGAAPQPRSRTAPAVISNGPGASLTERERALQNSSIAPAARGNVYPPPPPSREEPATQQRRDDRPPTAPQRVAPAQQRALTPDDPTRAYGRPSTAPVYRAPAASSAPPMPAREAPVYEAPVREAAPRESAARAAPVREAPPSRPLERPPAPPAPAPRAPETKDPRDAAAHADRNSRERAER